MGLSLKCRSANIDSDSQFGDSKIRKEGKWRRSWLSLCLRRLPITGCVFCKAGRGTSSSVDDRVVEFRDRPSAHSDGEVSTEWNGGQIFKGRSKRTALRRWEGWKYWGRCGMLGRCFDPNRGVQAL